MTPALRDALWAVRAAEARGAQGQAMLLPTLERLDDLLAQGFVGVAADGESWRLTDAGRAAVEADVVRLKAACQRRAPPGRRRAASARRRA